MERFLSTFQYQFQCLLEILSSFIKRVALRVHAWNFRKLYNRLKDEGYLVKSIHTENLCGLKNGKVIAESANRNMVLLTSDQDFLKPPKMNHVRILVLKIHPRRDKVVIPIVMSFLNLSYVQLFDWKNKIVLLTEKDYEIISEPSS